MERKRPYPLDASSVKCRRSWWIPPMYRKTFAMMEAVLILKTIAQRYYMGLAPDQKVIPYPSVTLRPSTLKMEISKQSI